MLLNKYSAADKFFSFVKGANLAWRQCALRLMEVNCGSAVGSGFICDFGCGVAVTGPCQQASGSAQCPIGETGPVQVHGIGIESRSFPVFESDYEMILFHVFAHYDIVFMVGVGRNADSFALAKGVAMEASMPAQHPIVGIDYVPGFVGDKFFQKISQANPADKTDSLAVFFVGIGEAVAAGQSPHLRLFR